MKPSNELFILIKSLTKSEKRYFKRFCKFYSNDKKNNYLKLFEAIDNQSIYDESKIKKKFRGEVFIKQLSVTKDYLNKIILKSLNFYNSTNDPYILIKELITEAELLINKKLYVQSWKKLQRAKKLAYEYGYFYLVIESIGDERFLLNFLFKKEREDMQSEFEKEEKRIFYEIQNIREILGINQKIMKIVNSSGYLVTEEINIKDLKIQISFLEKLDPYKMLSINSKSLYYHAFIFANRSLSNHMICFRYSKELIDILESGGRTKNNDPTNYYWALHNYIMASLRLGKLDEARDGYSKLRVFLDSKEKFDTPRNVLEMRLNFIEVFLYLNMALGNYNDCIEFIEKSIEPSEITIENTQYFDEIALVVASTLFKICQYEESIVWLNKVSNCSQKRAIVDVSDILIVLVHYELGNFEIAETLIKRGIRKFRRGKGCGFEPVLLRNLEKILNTIDKDEIFLIFEVLDDSLQKYSDASSVKEILKRYYIFDWVKSKLRLKNSNII